MLNKYWLNLLSTELKNGSPIELSILTTVSIIPPTLSLLSLAISISFIIKSFAFLFKTGNSRLLTFKKYSSKWEKSISSSLILCIFWIWLPIIIFLEFNIWIAIAPKATKGAVNLPEKCPPPR